MIEWEGGRLDGRMEERMGADRSIGRFYGRLGESMTHRTAEPTGRWVNVSESGESTNRRRAERIPD